MLKKTLFPLVMALALTGCQQSNLLPIYPTPSQPAHNDSLTHVALTINAQDLRTDNALAKVNRDGKLDVLLAENDLQSMIQNLIQQQMVARGYVVGTIANHANLRVEIRQLNADVTEGNLRHTVASTVDLSLIVETDNGARYSKNYNTVSTREGAFSASNEDIAQTINQALSSIMNKIAADTDIDQFIKNNI